MSIDQDDPCIKELDSWIETKKDELYEKTFKNLNSNKVNTPRGLKTYPKDLKDLHDRICSYFRNTNLNERNTQLKNEGWPEELITCISDINSRRLVEDRLRHWCITFPNTKRGELLTSQIQEESGVNK